MEYILDKVKGHCIDLMTHSRCNTMPFHNVQHSLQVYSNVKTIVAEGSLTEQTIDLILLAALFHDTGNIYAFDGHEEISAQLAISYLEEEDYPPAWIAVIINCILATRLPQEPTNILEAVLCDADLFHLGKKDFFVSNDLLRTEWKEYRQKSYTDLQWYTMNVEFLGNHKFHTAYGKQALDPIKQENIALMETFATNLI